jgi:hypothetical protein
MRKGEGEEGREEAFQRNCSFNDTIQSTATVVVAHIHQLAVFLAPGKTTFTGNLNCTTLL